MGFLLLDHVQLVAGDAGPRNTDLKITKGADPLAQGWSYHVELLWIEWQRWQVSVEAVTLKENYEKWNWKHSHCTHASVDT